MFSIVGLDFDDITFVLHMLSQSGNTESSLHFLQVSSLLDTILQLLLQEFFSTRKDVLYWERLSKSRKWVITLHYYNTYAYNWIHNRIFWPCLELAWRESFLLCRKERVSAWHNERMHTAWNSDILMVLAEQLKADLRDLSVFLDRLCGAAEFLKVMHCEIRLLEADIRDSFALHATVSPSSAALSKSLRVDSKVPSIASKDSFNTSQRTSQDLRDRVSVLAKSRLGACLLELLSCLNQFVPHLVEENGLPMGELVASLKQTPAPTPAATPVPSPAHRAHKISLTNPELIADSSSRLKSIQEVDAGIWSGESTPMQHRSAVEMNRCAGIGAGKS